MATNFSRREDASPSFQWTNLVQINEGEYVNFSWETYNTIPQKYLPFNFSRIINNSTALMELYSNQDERNKITVPAGTIMTIDRRTIPAVSSWRIKAVSGNAAIGKIIINNSREAVSADTLVTRLYTRLFGRFK